MYGVLLWRWNTTSGNEWNTKLRTNEVHASLALSGGDFGVWRHTVQQSQNADDKRQHSYSEQMHYDRFL